jgi:alpha-beta hydrolase superfamily lysophospholipase
MIASRRLDWIARHPRGRSAMPLHLFLAEHDDIIRTDHTKAWARNLPWPDRRITQYKGARHTLEFEPDPQPFFNDLLTALTD